MADEGDVYAAISAKLSGDATLMSLMTDGVYQDVAPANTTKVVIISRQADDRTYGIDRLLAYEDFTYAVKAVIKDKSGVTVRQAATRIKALLHDATLTFTGYSLMRIHLSEDNAVIRYTEVDPDDSDARWQHRGWLFDVMVSPT